MPEKPFKFAPGCSQTPKRNSRSHNAYWKESVLSYESYDLYYGYNLEEENHSIQQTSKRVKEQIAKTLKDSKKETQFNKQETIQKIQDHIQENQVDPIEYLLKTLNELQNSSIAGHNLLTLTKKLAIENPSSKAAMNETLTILFNLEFEQTTELFIEELKKYLIRNKIRSLKKFKDHDFTEFKIYLNNIIKIRRIIPKLRHAKNKSIYEKLWKYLNQ